MRVDRGNSSIGVPQIIGGDIGPPTAVRGRGDNRTIPVRAGCLPDRPVGPSDVADATKMLQALFGRCKNDLVQKGFTNLRQLRLQVEPIVRDNARHFAACSTDGNLMVLSPDMALLPPRTCMGILQHEFGHAIDFSYPGQFWLGPRGVQRRQVGTRSNQGVSRHVLEDWQRRDDDLIERVADGIAEVVFGVSIGYCGPCRLQTLLTGAPDEAQCDRPRPRGLR